jgi:hypothetical protein
VVILGVRIGSSLVKDFCKVNPNVDKSLYGRVQPARNTLRWIDCAGVNVALFVGKHKGTHSPGLGKSAANLRLDPR